ncbi:hypothetical protein GCM10022200_28810 [Microbacterium awajiense]|uniref:Uncharacterized protein n=1 Tax=Microbacterium awajiense TaxID=415214 RepID=A0ABP7AZ21_9MICO
MLVVLSVLIIGLTPPLVVTASGGSAWVVRWRAGRLSRWYFKNLTYERYSRWTDPWTPECRDRAVVRVVWRTARFTASRGGSPGVGATDVDEFVGGHAAR